MEVGITPYFTKRAKRLSPKERKLLDLKTEIFQVNYLDARLKTHRLKGKLQECLSFSLTHSKWVKFILVSHNKALFVDVGSHDEVY